MTSPRYKQLLEQIIAAQEAAYKRAAKTRYKLMLDGTTTVVKYGK